jgi:mannose-6-phosphate isomerase-like protein (cupin superfamily)
MMDRRAFLGNLAGSLLAARTHAKAEGREGEEKPTVTKGKFAVPVNPENVKQDWTTRGYSAPQLRSYPQGWSRGEHTHPVSLIMTVLSGRMEFTFAAQRFVLEAGDELSYAANPVHSAKNLYDGSTLMLESEK